MVSKRQEILKADHSLAELCALLELWENVLLGLSASSPQTILVAHGGLVASYQPLLLLQTQKVQTPYSCSVLVA